MGLLQRQQNEGENQDFIALYHLCTGFELSKMGDTEGAVNHFQKAIDIYKCNSSKINILFGFTLELAASFLPRLNFRGQPRCTSQLWNFSSSKRPLIPTSLQYFATTLHACCLLKMTWRGADEMPVWEDLRLGLEQLGKLIETAKIFRRAPIVCASNECCPLPPVGGDIHECLWEALFLKVKMFSTLRRSCCAFL